MCKKVIVNGTKIFGIKKTENSELQSMSPPRRCGRLVPMRNPKREVG